MPESPSKFEQFWNELKRRKVVRVIVVYAAASYVILELISIIEDPFSLPDWTIRFVFVILCIGLVISIILSWIYDITPGGIEKTKPVKEVKDDIPEKPSGIHTWKMATYISVLVIIGLIIFNIFGRRGKVENSVILDKSIAVRPFWNESTEKENEFFVNGMTEDIRNNLSKIADLRVLSRGSVEKYRDPQYSTTDIASDLDVTYVLEGTAQRIGNQVKIHVQLILAEIEDHVWDTSYEDMIDAKQFYDLQGRIAQSVAKEIKAIITPDEIQLIEKVPTHNLTAYDYYQRGREEHIKYWVDPDNKEAQERAQYFYNKALKEDTAFAKAYTGITQIYYENLYAFMENHNTLDSILIRTEVALSLDDQDDEAYRIRAQAYRRKSELQKAKQCFEAALTINPNNAQTLRDASSFYINYLDDYVKGLECLHRAAGVERSSYLAVVLRNLAKVYMEFGFIDKAHYYNQEATEIDIDSTQYYSLIASIASRQGDQTACLNYRLKVFSMDTADEFNLRMLGKIYLDLGEFMESIKYYEKFMEIRRDQIGSQGYRIGFVYWNAGYEEKAKYYLNENIIYLNRRNELSSSLSSLYYTYFFLAQTYAFLEEEDKAFENLRIFNQKQTIPYWMVLDIKNSPLFNNIRNEPEFQQIVRDVETKYEATREQVKQWMEENDMV